MEFSSKLLENAVNEVSQLPGIGKRTALRLVLHLLRQPEQHTKELAEALLSLRTKVRYCQNCHNISDRELCEICSSTKRDRTLVCVVEDIRDVMAIENTGQYTGVYHVLGGKISPMDGVGPSDLNIVSLIEKVKLDENKVTMLALISTTEGDTNNIYIFKQLEGYTISTSTIARGIAVGDELECADEVTLERSIVNRVPFDNSLRDHYTNIFGVYKL